MYFSNENPNIIFQIFWIILSHVNKKYCLPTVWESGKHKNWCLTLTKLHPSIYSMVFSDKACNRTQCLHPIIHTEYKYFCALWQILGLHVRVPQCEQYVRISGFPTGKWQQRDVEMLPLLPRLIEQLEVVSLVDNSNMKIFIFHVSDKFI